jgi:hypothetical protein
VVARSRSRGADRRRLIGRPEPRIALAAEQLHESVQVVARQGVLQRDLARAVRCDEQDRLVDPHRQVPAGGRPEEAVAGLADLGPGLEAPQGADLVDRHPHRPGPAGAYAHDALVEVDDHPHPACEGEQRQPERRQAQDQRHQGAGLDGSTQQGQGRRAGHRPGHAGHQPRPQRDRRGEAHLA